MRRRRSSADVASPAGPPPTTTTASRSAVDKEHSAPVEEIQCHHLHDVKDVVVIEVAMEPDASSLDHAAEERHENAAHQPRSRGRTEPHPDVESRHQQHG